MDLHKFGIKFFAADAEKLDILKLIPIYHRWIQQGPLEDLLIDVADYSHVPSGPGVMLIAHEGNYALDETGHERGVVYYSKHRLEGELPERFAAVARKALKAARLMTEDNELEGALKRVLAYSNFHGQEISLALAKDALRDLLAVQNRQISIENIQKTVADYYKIRVTDMHSKKRSRAVARPRQVAMALAKELTQLSLPEIGSNFGGRDHTTVLHACRQIAKLRESLPDLNHDVNLLLQVLRS